MNSSARPNRALAQAPAVLLALLGAQAAWAGDFRLGVGLGYGGTGIETTATVAGADEPVQRSEGPGTISLSVEYLLTDRLTIAIEQIRGFRLGPITSGTSFTGLAGRWFFLAPTPTSTRSGGEETTIVVKNLSPFIGVTAGIATGDIHRDDDAVPDVSGSGVYAGFKVGLDYPIFTGVVLRPEIDYGASLFSSAVPPAGLTLFSAQIGLNFIL